MSRYEPNPRAPDRGAAQDDDAVVAVGPTSVVLPLGSMLEVDGLSALVGVCQREEPGTSDTFKQHPEEPAVPRASRAEGKVRKRIHRAIGGN